MDAAGRFWDQGHVTTELEVGSDPRSPGENSHKQPCALVCTGGEERGGRPGEEKPALLEAQLAEEVPV